MERHDLVSGFLVDHFRVMRNVGDDTPFERNFERFKMIHPLKIRLIVHAVGPNDDENLESRIALRGGVFLCKVPRVVTRIEHDTGRRPSQAATVL